jgi:hypothetical protein
VLDLQARAPDRCLDELGVGGAILDQEDVDGGRIRALDAPILSGANAPVKGA